MAKPGKTHVVILSSLIVMIFFGLGVGIQRTVVAYEDLDEGLKQLRTLAHIMALIQDEYVDMEKTELEDLMNGAIHGMVESLDRYSVYMEKEEAKEFNDQTQGAFGGLGIQIDVVNGWLTVIDPLPNTPAAKAGLMSGDKIVQIGDESTKGMNIYEAVKKLKGEPGTDVTISVARREKELPSLPSPVPYYTNAVDNEEKGAG